MHMAVYIYMEGTNIEISIFKSFVSVSLYVCLFRLIYGMARPILTGHLLADR